MSGEPVFIYDCNGTAAQRVVPVDIDSNPTGRRQVLLYAGDKVIGVEGNVLIQQAPLKLQDYSGSAGQIFELDGNSIILAADRQLVVKVQHARSANLTPAWRNHRDLAKAEFWNFTASDGANHRPTRGFVRISQVDDFDNGGELPARLAFLEAVRNGHPGTVIELNANVALNLTDLGWLEIPAGVTILSDRRGTRLGPGIHTLRTSDFMFNIAGSEVRLTGLRLRGPSRSTDWTRFDRAILSHSQYPTVMDHNELSDWPVAAIEVTGDGIRDHREPRPENVRIARNFIHHNRKAGLGCGVVTGASGCASIEGNTFLENRHAITGDGTDTSGYRA